MSTATLEAPQAQVNEPKKPTVKMPHEWVGREVWYWRLNPATNELSALPGILVQRAVGGMMAGEFWDLQLMRPTGAQARPRTRMAEEPTAGCWTFRRKAQDPSVINDEVSMAFQADPAAEETETPKPRRARKTKAAETDAIESPIE